MPIAHSLLYNTSMTKIVQDSPDGRLAAFLLDQKLISQEQLDRAREMQQASGGYLSEILVNKGLIAVTCPISLYHLQS